MINGTKLQAGWTLTTKPKDTIADDADGSVQQLWASQMIYDFGTKTAWNFWKLDARLSGAETEDCLWGHFIPTRG